jgi:C4-dicarboxylate-specific signal transduction histidine kinase
MRERDSNYELLKEKYERHEQILIQAYKSLKKKENELKSLYEELKLSEREVQEKNEDLQAANEEINAIAEELMDKNTFIESQNKELKATVQLLKDTQSELVQSEKMASLGILTAGVAHEINNPLNYIMGAYVGLKNYFQEKGEAETELIDTLLSSIEEGVDRASKIVKSLSMFSRSNDNYSEICEVSGIIDNCITILNYKLKNGVSITKRYSKEELLVKGNSGKLHQVFINILSNAEQAMNGNGEIEISTERVNDKLRVLISDSGVGIEKDKLHRLIEPFYTTKAPGVGVGLGLSIAYKIIQEHQGSLNFESEIGNGTVVELVFPISG